MPLSEIAKSILALPTWLIIPYLFGSILTLLLTRLKIETFSGIANRIFALLLGIYSLIIGTFLLDLLGFSVVLANLYWILLVVGIIYLVFRSMKKTEDGFSANSNQLKEYLPIVIFCLLVSVIPALIKMLPSPFPYGSVETISIPFDQYQPVLRFSEFGYVQYPRVYDFSSIAYSSQLFNVDPLSFVWASPLLMMAVFSVGLYLLSYGISKQKGFALITVFIGSFLNMNIFRDAPVLFKANVFLYIFFPFILYLIYKTLTKEKTAAAGPSTYRMRAVLPILALLTLILGLYIYLIDSQIWAKFVPVNVNNAAEWY